MTNKLLSLRNQNKKRKPHFVVHESTSYPRMKPKWKKTRGNSSGVRQKWRGRRATVNPGYGSPQEVKGLHSSGLEKVIVNNAAELLALNHATQGAVIASSVGNRKRAELLKLAQEKKIRILNVKNVPKLVEKLSSELAVRKKVKSEKKSVKGKKEEEKKKKAEEKLKKEKEEADKAKADKKEGKEKTAEENKTAQEEQKEAIEKELIKRQ
ncbi:50S ribosomal protein L32e [Candidatus Woesearchaeota archaeon]|nr:50S ribosomal protein L32e [Candidatus Woesearchaeota archaeon]